MSKFDRGVFIFIGLGIWALAMVQMLKPQNLTAQDFLNYSSVSHPWQTSGTIITRKCPGNIKSVNFQYTDGELEEVTNSTNCNYLLTASYSDLIQHLEYWR